jgi:hypothetical protein
MHVTNLRNFSGGELRGDPPGVAARVFDAAAEVGVAWFVDRLLDRDTAGGEGLFVGRLRIRHVDVESGGEGGISAAGVGDHHNSIVDANFGMHDFAVGHVKAAEILGVECLLQKGDDSLRVVRNDVDGNGIVVFGFPGRTH